MGGSRQDAGRFLNSDAGVVIGDFPWYEMVWRSLRGDFRPAAPPIGGDSAFVRTWSQAPDLSLLATRSETPRVTWLGHVTVLLQVGGRNVLIDPTLCAYAGPAGRAGAPRKVPPPLAAEDLPPLDLVLISHNHYDHLDYDTVTRLWRAGQRPRWLVPLGVGHWLRRWGVQGVEEVDWWQSVALDPLTVHFTPAQHWSRRTPFDTNRSLWGGYVVEWARGSGVPWRFYFPGDTGYGPDFKAIRQRLGAMDLVALPIGAYLPRAFMRPMHIDPDEAVRLLLEVEGRQAFGVHWGTFQLSQEAIDQPPRDLAAACARHGVDPQRVWLLRHGETRTLTLPP